MGWLSDAEYNLVAFVTESLRCFYHFECEQYSDALKTGKKVPCRPFDEAAERTKKDAELYLSGREKLPEEKRVTSLAMSVKTLRKYVKLLEENDGIPEDRRGKNSTNHEFTEVQ